MSDLLGKVKTIGDPKPPKADKGPA
jgi:hypothetical protein